MPPWTRPPKPPSLPPEYVDPIGPGLPVEPPPPRIEPVDPVPWIEEVLPPEEQKRPPPQKPPIVQIEPVEKPPIILPPPPDITPPTIVPPVFEETIPVPFPNPDDGRQPPTGPPPTIITVGAGTAVGTFMVYVGRKLVLTMAASLGTALGKSAGAMLVGAVQKQLFRGTTIRFHSGQSYGDYHGSDFGGSTKTGAVGYAQAWRMLPQEFSYWEK